MGEQTPFKKLAKDNLALFHKYAVTRVVTTSPHCYNVFQNEYHDSTIDFQHYTQYVAGLIAAGKVGFPRKKSRQKRHATLFSVRSSVILDGSTGI
jgi:Fe-S oxidoreductase